MLGPDIVSEDAPASGERKSRPIWERFKEATVRYVLGVDDTPHHIALGVFLGFVVGATPTLGIQLIIYVSIATLTGANKISGILPVFVSNPLTAVPLYYGNWWVGNKLTGGSTESADFVKRALQRVVSSDASLWDLVMRILEPRVWERLWRIIVELWIGSFAVGLVVGVPFYFITVQAVRLYRKRKAERT